MDDFIQPGSTGYWILLGILVFGRGMDFLSTWVATPNLVLEANPLARRLGWKAGVTFNLLVCVLLAAWPVPAIAVTTTSLLVAARNFKSAWWMRTLGEQEYLLWMAEVLMRSGRRLFLVCLLGETLLTAVVGGALMTFAGDHGLALAVGLGMVAYALAVGFYSALSVRTSGRRLG